MDVSYLGSKRLVLQCDVLDRDAIKGLLSPGIDILASDLHLTVLHIGKSLDLYREITHQTGIGLVEYEDEMVSFLEACVAISKPSYGANIISTEILYTDAANYVVLLLEPDKDLAELREGTRAHFKFFLERCKVDDADEFLRASTTIGQHAPDWLPHITVNDDATEKALLPKLPPGERVAFGALHVRRSTT